MVFRTGANAALGLQAFTLTDVYTVAKVAICNVVKSY